MAEGREMRPKLLLLYIKADEPDHRGINARVSVNRGEKCFNLHGGQMVLRIFSAGHRQLRFDQILGDITPVPPDD